MKDTRFIELVNLYIDRQLSPADAAELEQEIQTNPRRRQTYRQYCRMHRATKLVYESFRAHAESQGDTPARQPASIARLENRQRRRARWSYAATGLAAAACLTFVVARNDVFSRLAPAATAPAPALASVAAPASTPAPRTVAVALAPTESISVPFERGLGEIASLRNGFIRETDYAALLAAARLQEQRLLDLGQSPGVRVSLFDDGVFEDRPTLRTANSGPTRRPRPTTEFTAFQFQR